MSKSYAPTVEACSERTFKEFHSLLILLLCVLNLFSLTLFADPPGDAINDRDFDAWFDATKPSILECLPSYVEETLKRQALHAVEISFIHPVTEEVMSFSSDLAPDIQDILNQVLELANQIGIGNAVDLFTFILINNLIAVFSVIIGGLLLGISPILSSMVNGYVIGIVVGGLIIDGRWEIIAPGILPHGILELPALFLAIALGLKVGRSVYHAIKTTTRNKSSKGWYQKYRQAILQVEPVLYGALKFAWNAIVPLIAIAALIEATATPALIDYVQNYLQ